MKEGFPFCPQCGRLEQVAEVATTCSRGHQVDPTETFCPNCGERIRSMDSAPWAGAATTNVRTNGFAVASFVLGLIMIGLPSLLAIIFGFVAHSQIDGSQGSERGKGLATWGIVLGFVGLIGGVIILIVLLSGSNQPACNPSFQFC